VTDGGQWTDEEPVRCWLATARLADRAVKQVVLGPYSFARAAGGDLAQRAPLTLERAEALTLERAEALNATLRELAGAGCPLIEVHEPAATGIADHEAERALFREAHQRLLDGVGGTHLSLAIPGGNADEAGIGTILAAPYASLAVDLVAGPDNWRLVVTTPGDRGIVCGAMPAVAGPPDDLEILLWAAGYAASTGGRGSSRVGLATASSLAHLPWDVAMQRMERLGEAARLVDATLDERLRAMDPRAVSSRAAALGRIELPPASDAPGDDDPT